MSQYDLLVRNGTVMTPAGESRADLAVADGCIVAIAPDLSGTSKEEINAEGLHVFPGVVDAHVHFNEPGRTNWEGFATLQLLLTEGYDKRHLPLSSIASLTADNIAWRFGLSPAKGHLVPGADADLVLVDLQSRSQLQA